MADEKKIPVLPVSQALFVNEIAELASKTHHGNITRNIVSEAAVAAGLTPKYAAEILSKPQVQQALANALDFDRDEAKEVFSGVVMQLVTGTHPDFQPPVHECNCVKDGVAKPDCKRCKGLGTWLDRQPVRDGITLGLKLMSKAVVEARQRVTVEHEYKDLTDDELQKRAIEKAHKLNLQLPNIGRA